MWCTSRCVPFGRLVAPVARQHGRYGPEGQYFRRGYGSGICKAGFAGLLLALYFFCRCQALMPCTMAGMDQIDSYVVCSHQGHVHPCRGAEAFPTVQTVLRIKAIPQSFLDKVVNAPVMQVCVPSKSLSWRRGRQFPMVFHTTDIPQLLDTVIDVPVVQVVQLPGSFTRRGAEADSHCPGCSSDHRDSPVLLRQGDRCPCCTGRAGRLFCCRGAESDTHGLVDHVFPSCSSTWWFMSFLCRSSEFHRCRRGGDSRAPAVAPVVKLVACSSSSR